MNCFVFRLHYDEDHKELRYDFMRITAKGFLGFNNLLKKRMMAVNLKRRIGKALKLFKIKF